MSKQQGSSPGPSAPQVIVAIIDVDGIPNDVTTVHPNIQHAVAHATRQAGRPVDPASPSVKTVAKALEGTPLTKTVGIYLERGYVEYRPVTP